MRSQTKKQRLSKADTIADAIAEQLYVTISGETFGRLTFEEKQDAIANGLRSVGARMEERALRESMSNAVLGGIVNSCGSAVHDQAACSSDLFRS